MGYKGVYGFSGDSPVLDYAGTSPVAMESPCAYASGDIIGTLTTTNLSGYVTGKAGCSATNSDLPGSYELAGEMFLFAESGKATLETYFQTNDGSGGLTVSIEVDGNVVETHAFTYSGEQYDFTVPYYRFRVIFSMTGMGVSGQYRYGLFNLNQTA